jgi:hypothetical protein
VPGCGSAVGVGLSPSWAADAVVALPITRGFASPRVQAASATSESAFAYAGACVDLASDSPAIVGVGAAR